MENKKIKRFIPLIFFILMVILIPNTYKKIQKDNCLNEGRIWEENICKEKVLNSGSLETIGTGKNNKKILKSKKNKILAFFEKNFII